MRSLDLPGLQNPSYIGNYVQHLFCMYCSSCIHVSSCPVTLAAQRIGTFSGPVRNPLTTAGVCVFPPSLPRSAACHEGPAPVQPEVVPHLGPSSTQTDRHHICQRARVQDVRPIEGDLVIPDFETIRKPWDSLAQISGIQEIEAKTMV